MNIRVKFKKYGNLKFISHLDVMRYYQKAMRRAHIPVAFSGGYSPHMILSFANPLGVGMTSEGEYFDIELKEAISTVQMKEQLNQVMVEGMEVVSCRILDEHAKNGMSLVAAADYRSTPKDGGSIEALEDKIHSFMEQTEIMILKKTKRSERNVNIRPMIYDLRADGTGLFMKVAAGSVENLKPGLVCQAFCDKFGLDNLHFAQHRLEMYGNQGTLDDKKLVSLENYGYEA